MKKALIALLAFGTLSTTAIPAKADTATVIEGVQTSITTGTDNVTVHGNRQTVRNRSVNSNDNTGTSMRSDQYSDTAGTRNVNDLQSDQSADNNSVHTRSGRTSR